MASLNCPRHADSVRCGRDADERASDSAPLSDPGRQSRQDPRENLGVRSAGHVALACPRCWLVHESLPVADVRDPQSGEVARHMTR